MRVVIDTNVLVSSALSNKAAPARIFEKFRDGAFELVVSQEILAEYRKALGYEHVRKLHGLSLREIEDLVDELADLCVLVTLPGGTISISADPDDDKFLKCAYRGRAEYIVSGDKHLLSLKSYGDIQIVSPAVFLVLLTQN
jgi:putative PIN family toxin of toxin-antitoxin system